MTLTGRDKKIAMLLAPVALVVVFWFIVLAPKRSEATELGAKLALVDQERDAALAQAGDLENSKTSYAKDYETVVRLGKAIPSSVDMPSLLVQLDRATRGTKIRFGKIAVGSRTPAALPATPTTPAPPAGGSEAAPAAAPGGAPAQTGPGTAVESAGEAGQTADQASATAGADAAATPSTAAATPTGGTAAPGLDTVPLTFSFSGGFFEMADFFHEMKRFVSVADKRVRVQGRLMKIDGFDFEATAFPTIKADVQVTVYLAPKTEGGTAGATPAGPPTTQQAYAAPTTAAPAAPAPEAAVPASTGGSQ